MTFSVIDTATGEYPDLERIALKEDWAKGLMYCDMEGFAIEEDGALLLLDECGRQALCPEGRFEIVPYVVTNGDYLRSLGDDELADEYIRIFNQLPNHTDSWAWLREWLKQEYKETEQ